MVVRNLSQSIDHSQMDYINLHKNQNRLMPNNDTLRSKLKKVNTLNSCPFPGKKTDVFFRARSLCLLGLALSSNLLGAAGIRPQDNANGLQRLAGMGNGLSSKDIMHYTSNNTCPNHFLRENICSGAPANEADVLDPYSSHNPKRQHKIRETLSIEQHVISALRATNVLNAEFSDNELGAQAIIMAMFYIYESNRYDLLIDVGKSILKSTNRCNEDQCSQLGWESAQSEMRKWIFDKILGQSPERFLAEKVINERFTFMYTLGRLKNMVSNISIVKESIIPWHTFFTADQIKLENLWQTFLHEELPILYHKEFDSKLKNIALDNSHSFYYLTASVIMNEIGKNFADYDIDDILKIGRRYWYEFYNNGINKYVQRYFSMFATLRYAIKHPNDLANCSVSPYQFNEFAIENFLKEIANECEVFEAAFTQFVEYKTVIDSIIDFIPYGYEDEHQLDIANHLASIAAKFDKHLIDFSFEKIDALEKQFIFSENAVINSLNIVSLISRNGEITPYLPKDDNDVFDEISRLEAFKVFAYGESRYYLLKRIFGRAYDIVRFDQEVHNQYYARDNTPFIAVMYSDSDYEKSIIKEKYSKNNGVVNFFKENHRNAFNSSLFNFINNSPIDGKFFRNVNKLPFADLLHDVKNGVLLCQNFDYKKGSYAD